MKKINATELKNLTPGQLQKALEAKLPKDFGYKAAYFCFRNNGKRAFENWYFSCNLSDDIKQALKEGGKDFSTLEICFAHNFITATSAEMPGEICRGIKGLKVSFEKDIFMMAPTDMLARNISFGKLYEQLFNSFKEKIGKIPENIHLEFFDCHQFIIVNNDSYSVAATLRGNQYIPEEEISRANVLTLAETMASWMFNNVKENGELTYKYWPSAGKYSDNINTIRLFMGTICLFRCAEFFNDSNMREVAIKNLRYNFKKFLAKEGTFAYVKEYGKAKLGGAALAAYAAALSGEDEFAEAHNLLFNFTERMQNADGSFRTFHLPPTRNDCQNFYPGEALYYWSLLYQNTKAEVLRERILRAFTYYKKYHLARRNPAFIPWHTQAYFNFLQVENNDEMREFIYNMNDWLLPIQQWDGLKAEDAKGRFYDPNRPFGPPHASSTGVYIEGLVDAFQIADEDDHIEQAENYARTIRRAIRSIMQLTFSNELDTYYINNKQRVIGGVRTTEYNNEIRVDNVQHPLMGILKLLKTDGFIWPYR